MNPIKLLILTILVLVLSFVGYNAMYVVPVDQYAIVTQFGRVVSTQVDPGLKLKIPFIQAVVP
ncbi:MAG: SPFH domain-containing protein, partial [Myxococcota bacterium]|nr:SPFH domain-containing protein [Myxococcota bacterium]